MYFKLNLQVSRHVLHAKKCVNNPVDHLVEQKQF